MEWVYLGLAVLLIAGTGVFVAAEFALLTLDKHTVEEAYARGDRGSRTLMRSVTHLSTQLSAAQVGITITTLLTGYLMEPSLGALLTPVFELFGLGESAARAISLVLALVVSTVLSMVLGELVPKNLAISSPMTAARLAVPLQYGFSVVFRPVIAVLNGTANRAIIAMGLEPQEENSAGRSADELTALVRHSAEEGTLDEQTADLVTRTLGFSGLAAEDVMTPRTRMTTVNRDTTATQIVRIAARTGYSRFPVVGDNRDDIIGVVHLKKAVAVPLAHRDEAFAAGLMTEVAEIPDSMALDPLLIELRSKSLQMAVVIDEYGGTAGVVTLEDVVEELVGEVVDEHDRMRVAIRPARDGSWIVPGRMRPDEIKSVTGIEIPEDPDYETVAGYVLLRLGRLPAEGASVELGDTRLTVEKMYGRRIERLRLLPGYAAGRARAELANPAGTRAPDPVSGTDGPVPDTGSTRKGGSHE